MKFLFFLFMLFPALSRCQDLFDPQNIPINKAAGKIDFVGVVHVDSLSKEKIFNRARDWVTREFSLANMVLTMEDRPAGKLIVRGTLFGKNVAGLAVIPYTFAFNLILLIKEGKYKYEITDFIEVNGLSGGMTPDFISADIYVTDPKYKDRKGLYTGRAKEHLLFMEGNSWNLIFHLRDAILSNAHDYPSCDDF